MIFAVLFEDVPNQEHQRQAHMAAHLEFLETQAGVLGAGPLFDLAGGRGGLWLIDAPDASYVDAMVRQDPFFDTGLRKTVTVLEWRQVFRDGVRQI